jgi:DNA repair exonuclease SbcCD ATPase subunit
MSSLKSVALSCCVLLSLVTNGFAQTQPTPTPVTTQVTSPEAQLLRALLEEVRQLRTALQQTTIGTLRARLLIEQLAKQQTLVDTLSEEINQLKALITQAQDTTRGDDDLQELEAQIRECADPQERARLMQSYAALKRAMERERAVLKKEAVEQQARQMQLENTLRAEQTKLAELQGQLEDLDRELEKLATGGKLKLSQ